jgi:hypothetical protein
MANPSLVWKIEAVLVVVLIGSAALAFSEWREYGCGVLLLYAGVRIVLRGI